MSDNRVEYSQAEWDRCFAVLESQCAEFDAKVREGSELLVDCRERLSKALKEFSVTGDFAESGLSTCLPVGTECENGAGVSPSAPSDFILARTSAKRLISKELLVAKIDEAERHYYATQHRLRLDAEERWPGEE